MERQKGGGGSEVGGVSGGGSGACPSGASGFSSPPPNRPPNRRLKKSPRRWPKSRCASSKRGSCCRLQTWVGFWPGRKTSSIVRGADRPGEQAAVAADDGVLQTGGLGELGAAGVAAGRPSCSAPRWAGRRASRRGWWRRGCPGPPRRRSRGRAGSRRTSCRAPRWSSPSCRPADRGCRSAAPRAPSRARTTPSSTEVVMNATCGLITCSGFFGFGSGDRLALRVEHDGEPVQDGARAAVGQRRVDGRQLARRHRRRRPGPWPGPARARIRSPCRCAVAATLSSPTAMARRISGTLRLCSRAVRTVISPRNSPSAFFGVQRLPPVLRVSGASFSFEAGEYLPLSSAATKTIGLKQLPAWRWAWETRSNSLFAKSRPPT